MIGTDGTNVQAASASKTVRSHSAGSRIGFTGPEELVERLNRLAPSGKGLSGSVVN